jgi:hypothetical protein
VAKQLSQEPSATQKNTWTPANDEERNAVRKQLNCITESSMFKNSKRCTLLLSYVVEKALSGTDEHLKERTIGFELFEREADYDTNEDPVVRTTALDVRKRLAQYYHDFRHEANILIDLPARGYTPEFRLAPVSAKIESPVSVPQKWPMILLVLAAAAVLLTGAVFWIRSTLFSSALDKFWNPALTSPAPAIICVTGVWGVNSTNTSPSPTLDSLTNSQIGQMEVEFFSRFGAYNDSAAVSRIVGLMMSKNKPYRIKLHRELKLEDFSAGPVILIGGVNNQWTNRVLSELRFHFQDDSRSTWISDRQSLNNKDRLIDLDVPYRRNKGYAIISRVSNPAIGKNIVSIAGLSAIATSAASEFLTDPSFMETIVTKAPKSWDRKNMQIVISMNLEGSSFGPPQVEAAEFW